MNLKLTMGLLAVVAAAGFGTAYAQSTNVEDYTVEERLEICTEKRTALFNNYEYLMERHNSVVAENKALKENGVGGELERVKTELEDTQKELETAGELRQKYFDLWKGAETAQYLARHLEIERDKLQERIDNFPRYIEIAGNAIKTIPGNSTHVEYFGFNDDNALDIIVTSSRGGSTEAHIPRTVFDARADGCTGEDADFTHVVKMGTLNDFTISSNEHSHVFEFDVGRGTNVITVTGTCALGV